MSDITNDSVDVPSSPTSGSPPATAAEDLSTKSHIEKNNSKIMCDGAPSSEEGIVEKEEELLVLPPEVWASVMECKLIVVVV